MRKYWYRRSLMILLLFTVLVGGGACIVKYQTISQKREVSTEKISEEYLIPGGMPIGIYMETNGVMVLGTDAIEGTDGDKYKPADHIVRQGDYITGINDELSLIHISEPTRLLLPSRMPSSA